MKQRHFTRVFYMLLLLVTFSSCAPRNGVKDPEDIGTQVFDILKSLDDLTKEDFVRHFIDYDEMHEVFTEISADGSNTEISQVLKMMTEQLWETYVGFYYTQLKKVGDSSGINWKKIEFSSFNHSVDKNMDGTEQGCSGVLKFKSGEALYTIQSYSVYHAGEYKLISLNFYESL